MKKKIQWGILGTAAIAVEQVIPAIRNSEYGEILAIASRSLGKAEKLANEFQVPKFLGSYEALLADDEVQAVYIPLPNHLHVDWAIKALKAGKHVLVEKPIAMNCHEAKTLLEEAKKHPELKVMEAFMYKFHPQWITAKKLVQDGSIGTLRIVQASFSFYEDDPDSIVNSRDFGGGSLMDVGCYPVSISRFLFHAEPIRIVSSLEYHPEFDIDIHASGVLEFEKGRTIFFSSIRLVENQAVKLFGTEGSIEFEIPFNPLPGQRAKIWLTKDGTKEEIDFKPCNQYTLQADAFSKSILDNTPQPVSLEDALKNMVAIQAVRTSDRLDKVIHL
ncbi:Gfo/Idh/MocA family oxidoreductase [Flavobacteriaceae bacterium F89]|uniref:Gfo/Idh/MocA family oxidoreductase n=1 Tax=Cerina litoralis TaxID=2874477 RepID=A0AAE3JSC5_9FLAO|nr:Gfo/Idh/MocA family oxidoreductase [Cerina litoralis]MCG2460442.1 Gfo/Idh/MocA family oxidoreductase [Cerina litoralis]